MPDNDSIEEQAMLYVLGQLDDSGREAFEARLAVSPELRVMVQEMELAGEVLSLAAPQIRAPKRVWRRILAQTEAADAGRAAPGWRSWLVLLFRGGWIVAALMALTWLVAQWTEGGGQEESPPPGAMAGHPRGVEPPVGADPGRERSGDESQTPALLTKSTEGVRSSAPVGGAAARENALRLRARVQQLSTEVADLNRILTQQTLLPPGAQRFQVFRLAGTNAPPLSQGLAGGHAAGQAALLEQWLARALARQLVDLSANREPSRDENRDSSEDPPEGTQQMADNPSATQPLLDGGTNATMLAGLGGVNSLRVVELNPAVPNGTIAPLSDFADRADSALPGGPGQISFTPVSGPVTFRDTTGLGFYSADTGHGSIALVLGQDLPRFQSLQAWAFDNETGAIVNLGTTSASAGPLLLRFAMDPAQVTNPGFMITVEPEGGSVSPTGPVIVGPPPIHQPSP
jgi:anti-sigma-K factor RskA